MRTCEGLGPLISAYADGELPPADVAIVEQHLAECEECRRMAADFKAVDAAAGEVAVPGEGAWSKVWEKIESPTAASKARRAVLARVWRGAFWVAAAASLLLALIKFAPQSKTALPGQPPKSAGFEVVSIEVASVDYTPVLMATNGGNLPVVWVDRM